VLQCVAVCCSVLQCVAVCCSVLQCIAVQTLSCIKRLICFKIEVEFTVCGVCIEVYCVALCSAEVGSSVLQCVAVWCSVNIILNGRSAQI